MRAFDRGRLLVQRLAGIQPRAGVVVGMDVGGRVGRRVQDQDVRADERAEDGERESDEVRRARLDEAVPGRRLDPECDGHPLTP